MSRKKAAKKSKKLRREKELVRAQAKSGYRDSFMEKLTKEKVSVTKPKKVTHTLHINYIKTGLIKTVIFIVFAVILIFILKNQDLQLDLGVYK